MMFLYNIQDAYNEFGDSKFYSTYYNPDEKLISPLVRYGKILREEVEDIFGDDDIQWSILLDDGSVISIPFISKPRLLCSRNEDEFKSTHKEILVDFLDTKIKNLEDELKELKNKRSLVWMNSI